MTPARFSVQALIVLALVALVSWPNERRVRAGAFWYAHGPLSTRGDEAKGGGTGLGSYRYHIGYGSASETALGAAGAASLHRRLYEHDIEGRRRPMPREVLALGGRLNGILGYARTARNAPIPFARVVLRHLASGAVEARGVADESGRFTFLDVIPSGYIVELLDANGAVIATSDPIAIAVNELRQTTVRAAGPRVFASFGSALGPTAHEPVATAAGQGVTRIAAPERCASPPCHGSSP
ncbi:MAG: carboxypeptidase-like regulatory domain-containing protein [Vicinamibacterales bacterium]